MATLRAWLKAAFVLLCVIVVLVLGVLGAVFMYVFNAAIIILGVVVCFVAVTMDALFKRKRPGNRSSRSP